LGRKFDLKKYVYDLARYDFEGTLINWQKQLKKKRTLPFYRKNMTRLLAGAGAGISGDAATQTTWIRTIYRVRDI
jgi:hypothetical protein